MGFRANKCYIVPSLDPVVAHVASDPMELNEANLIGKAVDAVI